MALLDTTQKRVIAAVLAVVLVLGVAAGAYILTRPSVQDYADSAAQDAALLLARDAGGEDVSQEGNALIAQVQEDTNCSYVGGVGGLIPADPAARNTLIQSVRTSTNEFLASHEEGIVGEYYGDKYGAVIALDCAIEPTPSAVGRTE